MIELLILIILLVLLAISSAVAGGAAIMYTLDKEAHDLYCEWMRRRKARRAAK